MNNINFQLLTPDEQIKYNMLKGIMQRKDTNLLQAQIELINKCNRDIEAASQALKNDILGN